MFQSLIPFEGNVTSAFEMDDALPAPSEINPLPDGQSQIVTIIIDQDYHEMILASFLKWFEDWDHVILRGQGPTEKEGDAFITLEWEGCYIDQFFLQMLRKEEPIIDFVTCIRDGRA